MIRLVILTMLVAASGCATHPTKHPETLSGVRLSIGKWTSPSEGSGTLVIRRDAGAMNGLCQMRIALDSDMVADLLPKEEIRLYPPPGEYIVRASLYGMCGGGIVDEKAIVKADREEVLRVAAGQWGDLRIQHTSK